MKKRILIVSEYFYPEEFKINEMALQWKSDGYEVDVLSQIPTYPQSQVLTGFKNRWYSKDDYQGITIYRVKAITGYKDSLFKKLLKYFVFMFNASIVALFIGKRYDYVFAYDVGPLTAMLPGVLIKKLYKKPFTIWVQDVWPDSVYAYGFKKRWLLSKLLNAYVKFIYRNARAIAVSGPGFIERVRPFTRSDKKIKYLPNWADDLTFDQGSFKFSEDKKTHFTFAGNIGKVQNLENVIDGFGALDRGNIEKSQLNIIGDGSHLEFLKKYVLEKKYENIIFWGKQPRSEMSQYFQGSDFLIVALIDKPIFNLTVPGKLQTYIAAKRPIFAVIKGDVTKIVEENKLGICAEPNDIKAIKEGFEILLSTTSKERLDFSDRCESLSNGVFNKKIIINSMAELVTNG